MQLPDQPNPIDFVTTWVNGNDGRWQEKIARYRKSSLSTCRFRDFDLIRFQFRSIEQYTPWVRRIFLVVDDQLPAWLNRSHPKLQVINHRDFIPSRYLPVFNSCAIQLHLHRIESLSEQFVLFDDDFLLLKHLSPEDFFQNGLPCDFVSLRRRTLNTQFDHHVENSNLIALKTFPRPDWWSLTMHPRYGWRCVLRNLAHLLTTRPDFLRMGFWHCAQPLTKSTFAQIWADHPELCEKVASHKFRTSEDVNHYAARYLAILQGRFRAVRKKRHLTVDLGKNIAATKAALAALRSYPHGYACISDSDNLSDPALTVQVHRLLVQSLTERFPQPSLFETRPEDL